MALPTARTSARTAEVLAAWFAACLSVTLAVIALEPSGSPRVFAALAGAVLAMVAARRYVRRATPLTTVLLTVAAAGYSTATVVRVSGISLASGLSCSQAGGIEGPSAWLFSGSSYCLAVGLLASGRLVARSGYESGQYGDRGLRVAFLLSVLPFIGFLVVGACRIGESRALYVIHNYAAVAAMGAFWVAMASTIGLPRLPRSLRFYAAIAALVILAAWSPTALKFMGITSSSPISTLDMELLVFALSFGWFGWVAREWGREGGAPVL